MSICNICSRMVWSRLPSQMLGLFKFIKSVVLRQAESIYHPKTNLSNWISKISTVLLIIYFQGHLNLASSAVMPPSIKWKSELLVADSIFDKINITKTMQFDGKIYLFGGIYRIGAKYMSAYYARLDDEGEIERFKILDDCEELFVSSILYIPRKGVLSGLACGLRDTSNGQIYRHARYITMDLDLNIHDDTIFNRFNDYPKHLAFLDSSNIVIGGFRSISIMSTDGTVLIDSLLTGAAGIDDILIERSGRILCTGRSMTDNPYGQDRNGPWVWKFDSTLKKVHTKGFQHFDSDYSDYQFEPPKASFFLSDTTAIFIGNNSTYSQAGSFAE